LYDRSQGKNPEYDRHGETCARTRQRDLELQKSHRELKDLDALLEPWTEAFDEFRRYFRQELRASVRQVIGSRRGRTAAEAQRIMER